MWWLVVHARATGLLLAGWSLLNSELVVTCFDKGMKADQLAWILGSSEKPLPSDFICGGHYAFFERYSRLGIQVTSNKDETGKWCVTEVRRMHLGISTRRYVAASMASGSWRSLRGRLRFIGRVPLG
jgi:hypothetical protein